MFGYGQGMVEDADGRHMGVVLEKQSQLLIGKMDDGKGCFVDIEEWKEDRDANPESVVAMDGTAYCVVASSPARVIKQRTN